MINLNFDSVNGLPILIVSSPRTGSTILAQYISKILNYKLFIEPSITEKDLHRFLMFSDFNKNYVLKEHASVYSLKYDSVFKQQLFFKIRIRRKNIFNQILSTYIAASRKKFFYDKDKTFIQDKIKLNEEFLLETVLYIKNCNKVLDAFSERIDMDLYYEDLDIPIIHGTPTPKPVNNEEFVNWAHNVLKDKL